VRSFRNNQTPKKEGLMSEANIPYRPAVGNPTNKDQQKELASAWQRQKENWRRTVAVRPEFRTWLHVAVAGEMDAHFNSKDGEAYPGTRTMAKHLRVHRRDVQRALDDFVEADPPMLYRRLEREPGKRPRNVYLMMGAHKWSKDGNGGGGPAYEDPDRRARTRRDGGRGPAETSEATSGASEKEEASSGGAPPHGGTRPPGGEQPSRAATPFPNGWELGEAELEVAQEVCPHWSGQDIIGPQFEKFAKWYQARNARSDNWPAKWRQWCQTGKENGWGGNQPRPDKPVQQPKPNVPKSFDVQDDYVQELMAADQKAKAREEDAEVEREYAIEEAEARRERASNR
jgi:hypothetical protein